MVRRSRSHASRIPRWTPLLAVAVALLASPLIYALSRHPALTPEQRTAAIRGASNDPGIHNHLLARPPASIRVSRLDSTDLRVTFWDGPTLLAEAAVSPDGRVTATKILTPGPRYGWSLSDSPLVLAFFAIVFAAASLRYPILCVRNLDVAVCISLALIVVTDDLLWVPVGVTLGAVLMAYLIARCLRVAFAESERPCGPLLVTSALLRTGRSSAAVFRLGTVALTSVTCLVILGSTNVIDVGFASAAGATLLNEGTLPYGHMPPEVVHGDTYPLLNYIVYMPGAWFAPIHDMFGDLRPTLIVAALAYAGMVLGVVRIGRRSLHAGGDEAWRLGLLTATFPTLVVTGASGSNDLVLGMVIMLLLLTAASPGASSLVLAAGVWIKVGPLALVPMWLARFRGGSLVRAAGAMCMLSAALLLWIRLLQPDGLRAMTHAVGFQLQRRSMQSVWGYWDLEWAKILIQAITLVLLAAAAVAVIVEPARFRSTRRLAGVIGASLLCIQLSSNYWAILYFAWVVPCLVVALFTQRGGDARDLVR